MSKEGEGEDRDGGCGGTRWDGRRCGFLFCGEALDVSDNRGPAIPTDSNGPFSIEPRPIGPEPISQQGK